MRILLLCHAFNSLTQRLLVDLGADGHEVTVEFDIHDDLLREAVQVAAPEVIVASFLKRAIPEDIWREHRCLVVHPGPEGDRGPAALDWAVLEGEQEWGVTVLQAEAEMDAGPVWAARVFPMREATKSSLYRNEVTEAAVEAVREALARLTHETPCYPARSIWRGPLRQAERAIYWQEDSTALVLRKIRSADGSPGVRDTIGGRSCHLFDAHPAPDLEGCPGALVARCGHAVARATVDGAVWIGHLREADTPDAIKLPADMVLDPALLEPLARVPGYPDIEYREDGPVGMLLFPCANGAMGTEYCGRLREAWREATSRPVRVLVLMGGRDFWSNGIDLNLIEYASSPADESWANINAMDDLCRDIIETGSQLTIAALRGNAGAGGVFLALAADLVLAREGVVLNPHYKGMGNLYGSEYWTYLLPRRMGEERARQVTQARLPVGAQQAREMGLVDEVLPGPREEFEACLMARAQALAAAPEFGVRLEEKQHRRRADESVRPLQAYREAELERLQLNFTGFDSSYHVARYNFVHKVPKSRTPVYLARHRDKSWRGA